MSKQDNSLYEQQEKRIQAQSDAFITLLTKRGILNSKQPNFLKPLRLFCNYIDFNLQ